MPRARNESFARTNRLSNASDFKRVFSKGKRIATRYFVIYSVRNHLAFARLAIQVRAKIGTAVERNYIKRMVREVFRKLKNDFNEQIDVIFIAEKAVTGVKYASLEFELRKALSGYLR